MEDLMERPLDLRIRESWRTFDCGTKWFFDIDRAITGRMYLVEPVGDNWRLSVKNFDNSSQNATVEGISLDLAYSLAEALRNTFEEGLTGNRK